MSRRPMPPPPPPPLNVWMQRRINARPTRENIDAYQQDALRETLKYAQKSSRFYAEKLKNLGINAISLSKLPFTTPRELAADPDAFLCVPPHELARVVTLPTSGTDGSPKRVFFTEDELDATADFFSYGMRGIAQPNGRVMIFMPGVTSVTSHGSVGDLLTRALAKINCDAIVYGVISDYNDALDALRNSGADCVVGIPAQMLALSRTAARESAPKLKSVLLSADYVPRTIIASLERDWDCTVFTHYGMTELCFGGAVDCVSSGETHAGAHLREADAIFEIVDPVTGENLPDGNPGELVITTLSRRAMPLIRYRTGDVASIISAPCPCGCNLKRLGRVHGRLREGIRLPNKAILAQPMLDEALFALPTLRAFTAEYSKSPRPTLTVAYNSGDFADGATDIARDVLRAVRRIPGLEELEVTAKQVATPDVVSPDIAPQNETSPDILPPIAPGSSAKRGILVNN